MGICNIKDNIIGYHGCHLSPNPAWADGAMCPACLNSGPCKPPVTCTGPNTPSTDCSKMPDILENCVQWQECVKSAGVGCYSNGYCPGGNCL